MMKKGEDEQEEFLRKLMKDIIAIKNIHPGLFFLMLFLFLNPFVFPFLFVLLRPFLLCLLFLLSLLWLFLLLNSLQLHLPFDVELSMFLPLLMGIKVGLSHIHFAQFTQHHLHLSSLCVHTRVCWFWFGRWLFGAWMLEGALISFPATLLGCKELAHPLLELHPLRAWWIVVTTPRMKLFSKKRKSEWNSKCLLDLPLKEGPLGKAGTQSLGLSSPGSP